MMRIRRAADAATAGIYAAYYESYNDELSALWRIAEAARTGELELGVEASAESPIMPADQLTGDARPGHFVGFGSMPPGYFDDE